MVVAGGRVEPIVIPRRPPERQVSIRLVLDHLVVTESRYGPGQRGPDPHVHHLHADCFYVLDGSITVSLRNGDRVLGPGTFALVPPDVVHAFRNDGPDEMRFLNVHAPGVDFDKYLLDELDTPFDQHPAPDDGGLDPATVVVRTAKTDSVSLADVDVGFLANAEETLGSIGLVEYTAPPGFPGPPVHLHEHTWDAYYVLDGMLAVRIGDDHLELRSGDVALVPPGTVHGFANPAAAPVRFLDVHAPGGFERYFRELAATLDGGQRDPAVVAQIASRYDMVPL